MTVTEIHPVQQQYVRDDCDGLSAPEVLTTAGITYRQLDYWSSTNRIRCRCWPMSQVKIMSRVGALLRRGLHLDHAFVLATNPQATAALLAELTYIQADLIEEEESA